MELSAVRLILQRYSGLFQKAYVYGSVPRGGADEQSDVDLILVRETKLPFFDRIREVFEIVRELAPVDIPIYTGEELTRLLGEPGRYLLKDIIAKGVAIEGTQSRGAQMAPAGRE